MDQTVTEVALPSVSAQISLINLFMQAHIVVKVVIIGLLLASVWSWAIIVDKTFLYRRVRKQMDRFEKVFWSGQSLEELYRSLTGRTPTAMAAVFVAAMREWKRSFESGARSPIGLQTRIDKVLDVAIDRETERLERSLLFLATVGSSAPFVGLFGTVWGIMTSFQSIAASKNTALAVVAPGIAEALLATALGLLAAIPAVIAYNKLSNDSGKITPAPRKLRRRVLRHSFPPGGREGVEPWPRKSSSRKDAPTSIGAAPRASDREINVTPFVDVMLVLLIVFMVTAPLLSAGVPVDLPEASAKPLALEKEPVTVTIDTAGKIFVGDSEVELDGLVDRLATAAPGGPDERIYVRGDKTASYGAIMRVMGVISSAGYRHIGLVALKEPDK